MALLPPFYIDCVVAIGIENNGQKNWIGTGFLFGNLLKPTEDGLNLYTTYLVTNKHVLKGLDNIIVRFNPQENQSSKDYSIILKSPDGKINWTGHSDSDIDVAVIQVNVHFLKEQGMKCNFFQSDKFAYTIDQMEKEGLGEGDFIYVLGFPMGIVTERQYVFSRGGTISRIRDLYEKRSKDFVVDAFVFPGNSGGPVVSKPENMAVKDTKACNKSRLIGMIKSYIPYKDVAVSVQTQKPRITFEENSGLSIVEPVDHILQTIVEDIKKNKNVA